MGLGGSDEVMPNGDLKRYWTLLSLNKKRIFLVVKAKKRSDDSVADVFFFLENDNT